MLSHTHQQEQYDNPFARQSDDFGFYEQDRSIEPDVDLTGQSSTKPSSLVNPFANLSGSIGSSVQPPPQQQQQATTEYYTGEDTLDEPVSVTILRDVKQVGRKLQQVLHPKGDRSVLKDWDLWGPLILCLALAITLSTSVPSDQSVPIFTGVFVIVWLGAAVVTMNAKLLGGSVSFFQSVCVIGYCIFPLVVVAIIGIFIEAVWFRVPSSLIAFAWSTYASVGFLSESKAHLANRRALAVYPLFLFYLIIAWLVAVS
ncbi:Yip1 domain-containing protein [Gilbertella persicaria]|uniref:Yip1 domain-containing protein n=1 Tax=Gilbertella persicaria TaxID=101096 RepID=UPI00221E8C20|nr:Yip1 domain-containing protein [Gilbertella persicaria]KAI8097970.1 Yip1 domain-containing protein [Gilbertella persicaria]